MRFVIKILLGFVFIAVVFAIYLATQVSATYPPLKTYEFTLTKDELHEQLIEIVSSIPGSTFVLTDSTGTKEHRYYYCSITIKHVNTKYKFDIKYNKETSFWDNDVKSEMDIIGAFNNEKLTGGYKVDDPDVENLLSIFERDVMSVLTERNTSR